MRDGKKLEALAKDSSVSDDEFFKAWLEYCQDELDASGKIIPITHQEIQEMDRLRPIIKNLRPGVMLKMMEYVAEQHHNCCGPGASSGNWLSRLWGRVLYFFSGLWLRFRK